MRSVESDQGEKKNKRQSEYPQTLNQARSFQKHLWRWNHREQTSHIQIGTPGSLAAGAGGNAGVQAHVGELRKRDFHVVIGAAANFDCLLLESQ